MKVGDVVEPKKKLILRKKYGDVTLNEKMKETLESKENFKVTYVDGNVLQIKNGNGFLYSVEMLKKGKGK